LADGGIVEWRCFMTHTYSAGGSRRTAVFTAIIGFHFGMFLLVASGLVPRPFGTTGEKEPPVVRLLPPEEEPWQVVAPQGPRPIEIADSWVPEPDTPLPDFKPDEDAVPLRTGDVGLPGDGVVVSTRAVDIVAPRLRMQGDRLAALINACYPAGARRASEEGRAIVRVLVGSDGKVLSWRILQGTGFPRLDEAVRCIIERLVIEPGRRDGRAVEAEALLPIVFRLD
jgi:protein TonB